MYFIQYFKNLDLYHRIFLSVFFTSEEILNHLKQLFIADVTIFYKEEDLDMAIGLSLTIMLVMYTMYQSISQSLPQTAYLKFIDVWLMFCLLVPFVVFVAQILLKIEIPRKINSNQTKKWTTNMKKMKVILDKSNLRKCLIFFIPSSTIIFILGYFLTSIYFYSNP